MKCDALVIGLGAAGFSAAMTLREAGLEVCLLAGRTGATGLSSGCIDMLPPPAAAGRNDPFAAGNDLTGLLARFIADRPGHPYALLDSDPAQASRLAIKGVERFARRLPAIYAGSDPGAIALPTEAGGIVFTQLSPASSVAGDLRRLAAGGRQPRLVLVELPSPALEGKFELTARLLGERMQRHTLGLPDVHVVRIPAEVLPDPARTAADRFSLARAFDSDGGLDGLATVLSSDPRLTGGAVALLPAVIGLRPESFASLSGRLPVPVAELLTGLPSVPGARLQAAMRDGLQAAGVSLIDGLAAGFDSSGRTITRIHLAPSPAGQRTVEAGAVVLATGGLVGGGLLRSNRRTHESLFDLPVHDGAGAPLAGHWFAGELTDRSPKGRQPVFLCGVRVNASFRPLDRNGGEPYSNLYACGGVLCGHGRTVDGSGMAVAIATGDRAAREAAGHGR